MNHHVPFFEPVYTLLNGGIGGHLGRVVDLG